MCTTSQRQTVAAACTTDTGDSRHDSNTQWVTFRDARFENISAKITALREVTPCSQTSTNAWNNLLPPSSGNKTRVSGSAIRYLPKEQQCVKSHVL